MAKTTLHYLLYYLEEGDVWYPGYDRRNMQAIDRNIAGLYTEVGPGVLYNWDVQKMPAMGSGNATTDAATMAERQSLAQAATGSYLAKQYQNIGSPSVSDEPSWAQIARVTAGGGIVGVYQAQTPYNSYLRYSTPGIFYVWADAGPCLISEGRVHISGPLDGNYNRDQTVLCTYLATVEVALPPASGVGLLTSGFPYQIVSQGLGTPPTPSSTQAYISNIIYQDKRNELLNLAGEVQEAIKTTLLGHKHDGLPGSPSKILLSTAITLTCTGPIGSTILLTYYNGAPFSWTPSNYGIPTVYFGESVLPPSDYTLQPSSGRIMLTNSPPANTPVTVVLPLSPQVTLTIWTGSLITDSLSAPPPRNILVYLSDGSQVQTGEDDDGDPTYGEAIFTWDPGFYLTPQVYLDDVLVSQGDYTIYPSQGGIDFEPELSGTPTLKVVLTHIGDQVQGLLPLSKVGYFDASTFTRGTIDRSRLHGLSHIGLARYQNPCYVIPTLRVFSLGDGLTYYPECAAEPLQYTSDIRWMAPSINLPSANQILGTKHAFLTMSTSNLDASSTIATWTPDMGIIAQHVDEVMEADPFTNHFVTTWVRADLGPNTSGLVYLSRDEGVSWQSLRLPNVAGRIVSPTCFHATTDRQEKDTLFLVTYTYSTLLYLGTAEDGFWTASILDGQSLDEFSWSQAEYVTGEITALAVISTLNKTITTSDDGSASFETDNYDRTIYLGTPNGLYVGENNILAVPITGIKWITDSGPQQNALAFWTADAIYFSNTQVYHDDETSNSSHTYWTQPLTSLLPRGLTARVATTVNITLSGTQTIDGVAVAVNDTVLVKNQTNLTQNGLYTAASGSWTMLSGSNLQNADVFVDVTLGTAQAGTQWQISFAGTGPYTLGTSMMSWTNDWYRPFYDQGSAPSSLVAEPGLTAYYALIGSGQVGEITLVYPTLAATEPTAVTYAELTWNVDQGSPRYGFTNSTGLGTAAQLVVATDRGLWSSSDHATTWQRAHSEFSSGANPVLFDEHTGAEIEAVYSADPNAQAFEFAGQQWPWQNFLYERDWTTYYTSPWNQNGADVVVYINGEPSTIPYTIAPASGQIIFAQSLLPTDDVTITIIRDGAFISDVGIHTHGERQNAFLVGANQLTTLSAPFLAGATSLSLTNRSAVPLDATYLQLIYGTNIERVAVTVDPVTLIVSLTRPRSGDFVFPATQTEVYLVSIGNELGLEDYVSLAQSNQTYHLNSNFLANTLLYSLARLSADSSLFNRYYGTPKTGTSYSRGLKNTFLFNNSDLLDPTQSVALASTELLPSVGDLPADPHSVTATNLTTTSGEVGTDRGVWTVAGGTWSLENNLNGAGNVYFLEGAILGSDQGVYRKTGEDWAPDPIFPQPTFAHEAGITWFKGTAEAWGKDDGLAFVWQPPVDSNGKAVPFESDHFTLVDGHRVYGFWYGQFEVVSQDADGNTTETPQDAFYLATELGAFGLTNCNLNANPSTNSFLGGREMFGANKPTLTVEVPNPDPNLPPSTQVVPVKFYRIFQALPTPTCDGSTPTPVVPIIMLSNNGIYRVRNWRWCDPSDPNGLIWFPEVHALTGVPCYCFAVGTRACSMGVAPLSKIFVGTDRGVFRSYDQGSSWENCERVGNDRLLVNSLQIVGSGVLVAGTENGLYYSDDDGDTWYRPAFDGNSYADYPYYISNAPTFTGGSLAQGFAPISDYGAVERYITSVSLYVEVVIPEGTSNPSACLSNTLSVAVYNVDSSGTPTTARSSSTVTPITAGSVTYPGFQTFAISVDLGSGVSSSSRFALVATETFASGSGNTSVFRWFPSSKSSPYTYGQGWTYNGSAWSEISTGDEDLFFQVYFQASPNPIPATVNIDFTQGMGRSFVVTDGGTLTMDTKALVVVVVDDSQSSGWSEPILGDRTSQIPAIFNDIWSETLNGSFQPSFGSVWTFGIEDLNVTGIINDLTTLGLAGSALFSRGQLSQVVETANLACSELNPQSIVDSVFAGNWTLFVTNLVTYLQSISCLGLAGIRTWFENQPIFNRSAWPYTASDSTAAAAISSYQDVSTYLVGQWAKSFSPLMILIADGEATATSSPSEVAESAASSWDQYGAPIHSLGLGQGSLEGTLRSISSGVNGRFHELYSESDWAYSRNSFLHNGGNTLFQSFWGQNFDFENPTWIQSVQSTFTIPTGATCVVSARWSADRINYTPWTNLTSTVSVTIDQLILALEFQVTMTEGFVNSEKATPSVSNLSYIQVTPGVQRVVTLPQNAGGSIAEYILVNSAVDPADVRVNWSIIRGATADQTYAEPIRVNRKGYLRDRQRGIQYTPTLVVGPLSTTTSDYMTYQVVDANSQPYTWASNDVVAVTEGSFPIPPSAGYYSVDYATGRIYFGVAQPPGLDVTVTITTPQMLYEFDGEPTTTVDDRTFYAVGGPWPPDASIVVLKNGKPMRGGFFASPQDGTITLATEAETTDIITLYVQYSGLFRVVATVYRYGTDTIDLSNFALSYTSVENLGLASLLNFGPLPQIANGSLVIVPPNPSTSDRVEIQYTYVSGDNTPERNSTTSWWRYRTGYTPVMGDVVDTNGFIKITAYADRTIIKPADLGAGQIFRQADQIYVDVTPSDGYNFGSTYSSPAATLRGTIPPYVTDLLTVSTAGNNVISGITYATEGIPIEALYTFNDPGGAPDMSTITWYDHDNSTAYFVGAVLPANLVVSGRVLNWTIAPYDGQMYGAAVTGPYIVVQ
jgi:hypothetical protein